MTVPSSLTASPPSGSSPTRNAAYRELVAQRNSFTLGMTVLFLALYLLLPILAGYNKPLMATKVLGNITFGCVLAFAEFIIGWALAYAYVVKARTFDRLAREALL